MSAWLLHPAPAGPGLGTGHIEVDSKTKKVRRSGTDLRLGPVEFRLVELLASEPDRVFSRIDILHAVWGTEATVDIRTIDAHVRHLRRTLGRDAIQTARGRGYSFKGNTGR